MTGSYTRSLITGALIGFVGFSSLAHTQKTGAWCSVPAAYDSLDAPGQSFFILSPFSARRQLVIDQSHLTALLGKKISYLQLRRNLDADDLLPGEYDLEITMSHTTVPAQQVFTRFDLNHGTLRTRVFKGKFKTKKSSGRNKGPIPWEESTAPKIRFSKDFYYTGGNICLDVVTRSVKSPKTGQSLSSWWPVDTWVESSSGTTQSVGTSCIKDLPGTPADADAASLKIGSSAVFSLRGSHNAGIILCAIGFNNRTFGGASLPLNLSPFGASGCFLRTDIAISIPATSKRLPKSSIDLAFASLDIPYATGLTGISLTSQWLALDSAENGLGLSLSNAVNCTVGPLTTHPGITWIETSNLLANTGQVLGGRVPIIRFWTQ